MKKIALIVENAKELDDYIKVLNLLSLSIEIKVKIIFLAELYFDKKQNELLNKINFNYEILKIKNIYNKPFKNYNLIEKIKLIIKNKKQIYDFIKDCNILLSGVQIIFERILYSQIKKNKLQIKTIVYHRHMLFDDKVNTSSSKLIHNNVVNFMLSLLDLNGFLIESKAVGFADKYMILGEINKSYLIEKGIDESQIECVGSLEYDDIDQFVSGKNNDIEKFCYITSACEWIGDIEGESYQKKRLNNFLEYCKKENIKDVTIRIHPREDKAKYEKLKDRYKFIKLQCPSTNPLLEDLKEFDVFIGSLSTVLFEVMLINKKVVFYVLDKEIYRYGNLLNQFSLPYVKKMEEFENCLINYKKVDGNKFITYDKNEKAIDRITNIIKKELNVK